MLELFCTQEAVFVTVKNLEGLNQLLEGVGIGSLLFLFNQVLEGLQAKGPDALMVHTLDHVQNLCLSGVKV